MQETSQLLRATNDPALLAVLLAWGSWADDAIVLDAGSELRLAELACTAMAAISAAITSVVETAQLLICVCCLVSVVLSMSEAIHCSSKSLTVRIKLETTSRIVGMICHGLYALRVWARHDLFSSEERRGVS